VIRAHRFDGVGEARSFGRRFLGLMGRKSIDGDGLWIPGCSSIHTCFMRMAIDVAFLDSEQRVVSKRESLAPWRLVSGGKGARSVLELPAGALAAHRIDVGDVIEW
jgi:uncharacterized membrane protein (UPF0127 family)